MIIFHRKLVGLLLLVVGVPLAAASTGPLELVQQTTDDVLAQIRANRAELEQRPQEMFKLVDEIIFPHFDFPRISQWVIGSSTWRSSPPEQRDAFVHEFRRLLVTTYSNALLEFHDRSVSYNDAKTNPETKRATVTAVVVVSESESIPILYNMHANDGDWKVFDVSVDGVSLVSTYRASFGAEIRKHGLAGLIASLKTKNDAKLSAQ